MLLGTSEQHTDFIGAKCVNKCVKFYKYVAQNAPIKSPLVCRLCPVDTWRNSNVNIISKRRHDVWRNNNVIIAPRVHWLFMGILQWRHMSVMTSQVTGILTGGFKASLLLLTTKKNESSALLAGRNPPTALCENTIGSISWRHHIDG